MHEYFQEFEMVYQQLLRKTNLNLLPLFFVLACLCYFDRTNLSYAALQLQQKDWYTKEVHGTGFGIFYIGYAFSQVPSNYLLCKLGASVWLAVLAAAWGINGVCFTLMNSAWVFYLLRFLLGVIEGGTYPGMYYVASKFYCTRDLSPALSAILSGSNAAGVIGGPIAGGILLLDGFLGVEGWQWLFIVEGTATFIFSWFVFFYLPDNPLQARFLSQEEKQIYMDYINEDEIVLKLNNEESAASNSTSSQQGCRPLEESNTYNKDLVSNEDVEKQVEVVPDIRNTREFPQPFIRIYDDEYDESQLDLANTAVKHKLTMDVRDTQECKQPLLQYQNEYDQKHTYINGILDWRVWYLGVAMCLVSSVAYSMLYWSPLITQSIFANLSNSVISAINAIPGIVAIVFVVAGSHISSRTNSIRIVMASACMFTGLFFVITVLLVINLDAPILGFASMALAAGFVMVPYVVYASWTTVFQKDRSLAAGLSVINGTSSLGGFLGSFLVGVMASKGGGVVEGFRQYESSICVMAGVITLDTIIILCFCQSDRKPERTQNLQQVQQRLILSNQKDGAIV
eukprot:TRINITY_DN11968_c1_g1_i2.p1 TRINITY_DN11968_c1_g1~~TRINITY_DN11968_c1_g1_i2.p1  ORF type:complete len:569 (+),score=62.23 TRINITY_DN11968_c1_g1_i2:110-1816(+)